MKKEALEDRLGAVLGRSWVVLGAVLGSKSCSRLGWRSFFEKPTFSNKSGLKTRLGTILGRFGSPKGVVLGGLLGTKLGQKRLRKVMRKKASSRHGFGRGGGDCG